MATAQYIETRPDGAGRVEFLALPASGDPITVTLTEREAERLAEELHAALLAIHVQVATTSCGGCAASGGGGECAGCGG